MSTKLEDESSKEHFAADNVVVVPALPVEAAATLEEQQEWRDLFTYEEGQKIIRKIDLRLVGPLLLTYILRGMDSGAISYVKTLNPSSPTNILTQLHMTSDQFGYTSTVFTLFYALGELPSNLLFKRTGPRIHYIRIIVLWSIAAICHAAAFNAAGLLTARAFLGIFEAGMAPGAYLHLTYWYRLDEVGPRFAAISAMFNFCNVFTALLCYGVSFLDGRGGLGAWQWVYIIQGLLALVLLAIIWFFMPSYPDTASFLTPNERKFIIGRLGPGSSRSTDKNFELSEFKSAIKDIKNLAFAVLLVLFNTGGLGLSFWLPTIITSFGLSANIAQNVLLTIPPAFLYWVGGIGGAYINDRFSRIPRPYFFWFAMSIQITGLFLLAFLENRAAQYAIIVIMYPCVSWAYQSVIPWRVQSISGTTSAAFVMAFLTGAGQTAGLWSAQIFQARYAPRYTTPFIICACIEILAVLVSAFCWYLTYTTEKETRRVQTLRRRAGKQNNIVVHDDIDFEAAKNQ